MCSSLSRRATSGQQDPELDVQVERELGEVRARHQQALAVRDGELGVERAVPAPTVLGALSHRPCVHLNGLASSAARCGSGSKSTLPPLAVSVSSTNTSLTLRRAASASASATSGTLYAAKVTRYTDSWAPRMSSSSAGPVLRSVDETVLGPDQTSSTRCLRRSAATACAAPQSRLATSDAGSILGLFDHADNSSPYRSAASPDRPTPARVAPSVSSNLTTCAVASGETSAANRAHASSSAADAAMSVS